MSNSMGKQRREKLAFFPSTPKKSERTSNNGVTELPWNATVELGDHPYTGPGSGSGSSVEFLLPRPGV
ncbi:hypothetical protein V6N11_003177 [Hibiscus sabdariffa]|uniref:Uncharacterized protein n=1 Tax=Hibiscus sabdariffa TaxID=183260 RepID=A0ABR2SD47_9ROSI